MGTTNLTNYIICVSLEFLYFWFHQRFILHSYKTVIIYHNCKIGIYDPNLKMEVELKSPHAHVVRDHYTGYIQKLTSCRSVMAFGKVVG